MTAEQLYSHIKAIYNAEDEILCDLHRPCENARKCHNTLKHPVINFDEIKKEFHAGVVGDTPASVDGITYTGNRFCFVEVKGWVEFLAHLKARDKAAAIKKQAASYDLNKKLFNSIDICQDLSGISQLLLEMPVTFVLVTDIETESDGLEMFHSNLLRLSESTDTWTECCSKELKSRLDTIPGNIPTVYVSCKGFDEKMSLLA